VAQTEFLTNVDTADMTAISMITAMRAMGDHLKTMNDNFSALQNTNREQNRALQLVSERLIRMEANSAFEEVKILKAEMEVVKATLSELKGASKFADLLRNFGPMFLLIVFIAFTFMSGHKP
jgi:uncharacterized UPF0160 family protein